MSTTTARNARGLLPGAPRPALMVLLVGLTLLATGCVQVQAADGGFVMGGSIIVREGEVARDDVVAVGGNVRIDGRAERDVVVVGGRLVINGEVERSVSCVGGELVLGPRARIGRDVVVVGGTLDRADSARVGGEFVNVSIGFGMQEWFAPMHWGFGNWWGFTPFAWVFRTGQLFYWLLLALLAVALVGDRVSSASHAISREPFRMGAIGFVGVFALCFAFLILLVLSFLIIGIPFLLALIFMWWLAYIFGAVAVFQSVGTRVMRLVGRPEASQIGLVLAGGLVIGILRYVPFFGGLIWLVVALVGLGSVFATRFGTGRPWVRRPVAPPPSSGSYPPYPPQSGGPAPEPGAASGANGTSSEAPGAASAANETPTGEPGAAGREETSYEQPTAEPPADTTYEDRGQESDADERR